MCCWKQHITQICEIQKIGLCNKNWAEQQFFIFVPLLRGALFQQWCCKHWQTWLIRFILHLVYLKNHKLRIHKTGSLKHYKVADPRHCGWQWRVPFLGQFLSDPEGLLSRIHPAHACWLSRAAETYVEDAELILALETGTVSELSSEMQQIAQFWEQLLYTTGGICK